MRSNHTSIPTSLLLLIVPFGAVVLLGACSADDDVVAEAPVISIEGTDYGMAAESTVVEGGHAVVSFTNTGEDFHHLQFWKVDDAEAAAASIRAGDLSVLAGATAVGGVGAIGPGATHRVASEVPEGEYVAFCLIETRAGAHNELGMVTTLVVEGESEAPRATADAELRITADGFDLPDGWDGTAELSVVNDHQFPADAEFLRLVDGATKADFLGFIDGSVPGPPPFTTEGGVAGLSPGRTSVVLDDIRPGNYLVASFEPNPTADMAPQFLSGHLVELTIG